MATQTQLRANDEYFCIKCARYLIDNEKREEKNNGGEYGVRTRDLMAASHALSQLS